MASETTGPDNSAGQQPPFQTICQFDTLITRSARRASMYVTGSKIMTADIAQDVRLHLLRALESHEVDEPEAIRRWIRNALRDRIRFERSRIQLASMQVAEIDDRNPVFKFADSCFLPEVISVAKWVASLPGRLRQIFELIYCFGFTQREAASILGLSQPRITQLHLELLQRGRTELATLAA